MFSVVLGLEIVEVVVDVGFFVICIVYFEEVGFGFGEVVGVGLDLWYYVVGGVVVQVFDVEYVGYFVGLVFYVVCYFVYVDVIDVIQYF